MAGKNKTLHVALLLVVVLAMVAGCSKPTVTPTPNPPPQPKQAPAPPKTEPAPAPPPATTSTPASTFNITTGSLPEGNVGVVYSQTLDVSGGKGKRSWSLSAGSLPPGLSIETATGAISGKPTGSGVFEFTAQVVEGKNVAIKPFSITIGILPLVVVSKALPNGDVGVAYSQAVVASGGSGNYTWSVTGGPLPAGLTLSTSSGVISGTPTKAGATEFTVQVSDGASTATQTFSVRIGLLPLTITTTLLNEGYIGVSYSSILDAKGGSGTYTWSMVEGSLPVGFSLAPTGMISGTATHVGSYNFTVKVTDGDSTATARVSITIATVSPIIITSASLPNGAVDVAYSQTLAASGGKGKFSWSISAGSLPVGLSLAGESGVIYGKPTSAGTTNFSVQVTDGITTATRLLSITVNPGLTINNVSLSNGHVGLAYSQTLSASGGSKNYTWSVSGGSLPTGLTLDAATGVISGTPTTAGIPGFTVQVSDGVTSATKPFSIKIIAALTITTASLPSGEYGTAYSQTLTASGGSGTYTWSITLGTFPSGLTLDGTTGIISGTPTDDMNASITFQVADGVTTASRALALTIYPQLTITTTELPNSNVGLTYSQTLAASGGKDTYTWSIATGSLPPTLSLAASTGIISGTLTAAGTFNFTVQVADGITAVTMPISIKVNPVLAINTISLPNTDVGVAYSQVLAVSGGSGIYTWSLTMGSLPAGLSLPPSTGIITGTPTIARTSNFTVQVADGITTATRVLSITINPALMITITATSLPPGNRGVAYSQTLTASGGSGIYTWSISGGALPSGLTLTPSTGVISGTPTTAGTFNFTVRVTDGIATATKFLSITVG